MNTDSVVVGLPLPVPPVDVSAAGQPAAAVDAVMLPLGPSPVLSYQHHSFPLSILAATGWKCLENWLFSHYVQIESPEVIAGGYRTTEVDFSLTPTHRFHFANSVFILNIRRDAFWTSRSQVLPAISALLSKGYYLQITMDDRFIPGTRVFGSDQPTPHESLLHGLDMRGGTSSILAFDAQMQFSSRSVPSASIERAIWECDLKGHYDPDGLKLLRAREERWTAKSVHAVLHGMDDYLGSKDSGLRTPGLAPVRAGFAYGLAAQEAVARFHEEFAARLFDIRPSHVLWEHKCLMQKRLEDLEATRVVTGLAKEYDAVVKEAHSIRLLALKMLLACQDGLGARIAERIRVMSSLERTVLGQCRDALAGYCKTTAVS